VILLEQNEKDPYFNLAAEEFILKNFDEEILMLWQSSSSVVIGKHQNPFKEVNLPYVLKNKIPVLRRLSGGGTVFHDSGNINFSFFSIPEHKDKMIRFEHFTHPVIRFLNNLKINATLVGKNNIVAGNKKLSGNSAHIFKNKILHHGTLLFNSNLTHLRKSLTHESENFPTVIDHSIHSIKVPVINIQKLIPGITKQTFFEQLQTFLKRSFLITQTRSLSVNEKKKIKKLAQEKYQNEEWIYGYSPDYHFLHQTDRDKIELEVSKGKIQKIHIDGILKKFEENLKGILHAPGEVQKLFQTENPTSGTRLMTLLGF